MRSQLVLPLLAFLVLVVGEIQFKKDEEQKISEDTLQQKDEEVVCFLKIESPTGVPVANYEVSLNRNCSTPSSEGATNSEGFDTLDSFSISFLLFF